jgi:hypothetical protein
MVIDISLNFWNLYALKLFIGQQEIQRLLE